MRVGTGDRRTIEREASVLARELRLFDGLTSMATEAGDPQQAEELRQRAWQQAAEAAPIRLSHAAELLGIGEGDAEQLMQRGALHRRTELPPRVALSSVLRAKPVVEEIRRGGRRAALIEEAALRLGGSGAPRLVVG
jgi:hypothetical protein